MRAILLLVAIAVCSTISAQFLPIPVTGFNQDVVAESGNSSLSTTTMAIDGIASSNKVMYNVAFRIANGAAGGGIPDNGIITDAAGSYQLAPYTGSNALLLQRSQNGNLVLNTPARFTRLRVLCFSAEGSSVVNATVFFTDGTSVAGVTNYTLADWFNSATNIVLQGFGRCTRATPVIGFESFPTNPRFYFIDIPLTCPNQQKLVQRINFANVTTAGSNAPYPNSLFWGISGIAYTQNITVGSTNSNCAGNNGSATVTVTGSTSPYNITWNTVPVQTGPTASNLAPGTYTATIRDVNNCVTTQQVTITRINSVTMTVAKTDATCTTSGSITITGAGGANYEYSINGGSTWQTSNVFNNVSAGTYSAGVRVQGDPVCTAVPQNVTILLNNNLTLSTGADTTICFGDSFTRTVITNAPTISWSPTGGVSNPSSATVLLSPTVTTPYIVTASSLNCSIQRTLTVTVNPKPTVYAGPDVTIIVGDVYNMQATASSGSYVWSPSTALTSSITLNPNANPVVTTPYTLTVTSAQNCSASDVMVINVLPFCLKPLQAFTPNGDGINDRWLVTNGPCVTNVRVQVFNRYGSRVYESSDYKNDWMGTYKNDPLPDGTYYYVIGYKLINGKSQVFRGNVTILR